VLRVSASVPATLKIAGRDARTVHARTSRRVRRIAVRVKRRRRALKLRLTLRAAGAKSTHAVLRVRRR
jgi:hypothetical protein